MLRPFETVTLMTSQQRISTYFGLGEFEIGHGLMLRILSSLSQFFLGGHLNVCALTTTRSTPQIKKDRP